MEENFLVYVNWLPLVHASSRWSVRKNVTINVVSIKINKEKKKKQEIKTESKNE